MKIIWFVCNDNIFKFWQFMEGIKLKYEKLADHISSDMTIFWEISINYEIRILSRDIVSQICEFMENIVL